MQLSKVTSLFNIAELISSFFCHEMEVRNEYEHENIGKA